MLKNFFRLLQAHSEAQPYYPLEVPAAMSLGATEVGSVFSSICKIQIVWSACFEQFKAEFNNLNFTRRDDFNGDYKLCQEKFLLAEQYKKDGLVQPETDAKKNVSNQKKTRFESSTKQPGKKHKGKCGYCGKWGHHKSECNDKNPANRKNNPVSYGNNKRPYPANDSSAGGKRKISKEEFIAKLKAKRELEQNQYDAYCLEHEGNVEYDEAWSSKKERGKNPQVSNIEKVKAKNSKLKPNSQIDQ